MAAPHLKSLWAASGENTHLAVLAGDHVVYVSTLNGTTLLSANAAIGQSGPLHCTATGKALIANLPRGTAEGLIKSLDFEAFTPRTSQRGGPPTRSWRRSASPATPSTTASTTPASAASPPPSSGSAASSPRWASPPLPTAWTPSGCASWRRSSWTRRRVSAGSWVVHARGWSHEQPAHGRTGHRRSPRRQRRPLRGRHPRSRQPADGGCLRGLETRRPSCRSATSSPPRTWPTPTSGSRASRSRS